MLFLKNVGGDLDGEISTRPFRSLWMSPLMTSLQNPERIAKFFTDLMTFVIK